MALRSRFRGKLLMDSSPVGPMLPRNVNKLPNANVERTYPDDWLFLAGGKFRFTTSNLNYALPGACT